LISLTASSLNSNVYRARCFAEELALRVQVLAPRTRIVRPMAGMGIGQQKAWLRAAMIVEFERRCAEA
jgi:hypothetical protein